MNIPWTNVGLILALGACFIAASWFISRKVSSVDEYISGRGTLGVAFGSTSILAFWITGNTIMAGPEAAYDMGVLGALGYGFLGGVAVLGFAPLAKRIQQIMPNGQTVGDFFRYRFDKKNYALFIVMAYVWMLGFLMTQGIGGGLLLEEVFDIPYELAVVLTFIVVILYSLMGGFSSVTGIAFFQVMLILLVVLVVPPLVYFTVGVSPVYEGMLSRSPESLNLLAPSGILFIFAGSVMGIGEVFMDNTFWQRTYAIRKDKTVRIFAISAVGWIFVPLAVASLAFVAISTGNAPDQVNQVAPFIAKIYGGKVANWIFLVGVWAALASTIAALINALVLLIINDVYIRIRPQANDKNKFHFARILTLFVGLAALGLSLLKFTSMLQMLILLGVVNAAFIFPIIYGLFWKRLNTNMTFLATVVSIVAGYTAYIAVGPLEGVVTSGWVSFFICWAGSLLRPANFDWELLRKVGRYPKDN